MPVQCAINAAQFVIADHRNGSNARARVTVCLALAALLISCSPLSPQPEPVRAEMEITRNDQVILLPEADGSPGAVIVRQDAVEVVLDKPYASAVIEGPGQIRQLIADPGVVRENFTPTLAALPSKPASFLLYFPQGEDELTAESKTEIEKILAEMAKRPAAEISVIGHTDTVGSIRFNDKLSLQRANHVRELIMARGVAPGSISVAGRGERELLIPTADNVHEPRNRRVEIKVR